MRNYIQADETCYFLNLAHFNLSVSVYQLSPHFGTH